MHGIRRIADILTLAGIDVSGWLLQGSTDVSADGKTVVGDRRKPAGDTEGWLQVFTREAAATRKIVRLD